MLAEESLTQPSVHPPTELLMSLNWVPIGFGNPIFTTHIRADQVEQVQGLQTDDGPENPIWYLVSWHNLLQYASV